MKIVLPQTENGYIELREDPAEFANAKPPSPGQVRLSVDQWLHFVAKAQDGALDQIVGVSGAMIDRAEYAVRVASHDPLKYCGREFLRLVIEYALNLRKGEKRDTTAQDLPDSARTYD